MVRQMNEDYKRGMRFLLRKCKESGINIRTIEWIPIYSKFLSDRDSCYRFWFNVWEQGCLDKIKLCNTLRDIAFEQDKLLFVWANTREGDWYWEEVLLNARDEKWAWSRFNDNKPLMSFV